MRFGSFVHRSKVPMVYLIVCAGVLKLGVSTDVRGRVMETTACRTGFARESVSLIVVSPELADARAIERAFHNRNSHRSVYFRHPSEVAL